VSPRPDASHTPTRGMHAGLSCSPGLRVKEGETISVVFQPEASISSTKRRRILGVSHENFISADFEGTCGVSDVTVFSGRTLTGAAAWMGTSTPSWRGVCRRGDRGPGQRSPRGHEFSPVFTPGGLHLRLCQGGKPDEAGFVV
jgi:hypothetical protein